MELPFVTIVMPIRNECDHIVACLESVLAGDYPSDRLELLALDGSSDDGTRDLVAGFAARYPHIRLVDNPERNQAHALNLGIAAARGDVVVRMDAHAIYPADYVRRCVGSLLASKADNVGGVCITVPGADTAIARAIAVALGHPFGVGNAHFRIGAEAPRWVDTVPFGCWQREVLERLGGFATDLPYAEDDELNARLLQQGGRILLDPAVRAQYIARTTLGRLVLMLYQYGYHKPFTARRLGRITTWRQLAPPLLVAGIVTAALAGLVLPVAWLVAGGIVAAHLVMGLAIGLGELRTQGPAVACRLPLVFAAMHGAYGWGYLHGLADLATRGQGSLQPRLSR